MVIKRSISFLRGALASLLLVCATTATAQAEVPSKPTSTQLNESRRLYDEGLSLYNQGRYEKALESFEGAYAAAPTYPLLYNIGVLRLQLEDFVGATQALRQYLKDGRGQIDQVRLEQVERELERIQPNLTTLNVQVAVPNAEVAVDGAVVGSSPLEEQVIAAGHHEVVVTFPDGRKSAQQVASAGGDRVELEFTPPKEARVAPKPKSEGINAVSTTKTDTTLPWAITAALTAGAVTTGLLALKAHSDEQAVKERGTSELQDVQAARDVVTALSLTTDILAGLALVSAGVSLYITLDDEEEQPRHSKVELRLAPTSASFNYIF